MRLLHRFISALLISDDHMRAQHLGSSDPVIKLTCGEVKASTKVVKKSLNPKYNETFKMPETSELELGDELVIVVEDWDLASG